MANTFRHLPPSNDLYGVNDDGDLLHLAATISSAMYIGVATATDFQTYLDGIGEVSERYPDLKVQFYHQNLIIAGQGAPLNDPNFAAVNTGTGTAVLAWRGSATPADWIKNFCFFLVSHGQVQGPGNSNIQVQGAYKTLIDTYFQHKGADLARLLEEGSVLIGKTGEKIERIVFTGHSLGGGLAQVAHQVLLGLAQADHHGVHDSISKFSDAIQKGNIEMHTIAFSSPMTIAPENSTYTIDNMANFVLKDDIFPRLYGNVTFLRAFIEAYHTANGLDAGVLRGLAALVGPLEGVLTRYHHVGKIYHYQGFESEITNRPLDQIEIMDRDAINYESAKDYHMHTVKGPGFAWGPGPQN